MTKAASSALDAVEHYKKKLTRHIDDPDPSVMLHCLAKLDRVPMTFDILQVRSTKACIVCKGTWHHKEPMAFL